MTSPVPIRPALPPPAEEAPRPAATPPSMPPARPRRRWLAWSGFLLATLAAGALFAGLRWSGTAQTPRSTLVTAPAARGNLEVVVNATGSLRPVSIVRVSTQQGGVVDEVLVDFSQEVRKGQVLARFRSETQRLDLDRARGDLAAAELDLRQAELEHARRQERPDLHRALAEAARAEVATAESMMASARSHQERQTDLVARGAAPARSLDEALDRLSLARQSLERARAAALRNGGDLADAVAAARQVDVDLALKRLQIEQARLKVSRAEIDLDRTTIVSPVDGTVVWKAVDMGQTISVNVELPTLFYIAQDLTEMQVEASVDEADIGRIGIGQTATYTVSAYPGRVFEGRVKQIRTGSDALYGSKGSSGGAVSYIVVIAAPNRERRLFPGMTASIRIRIEDATDQWLVPNQALRVSRDFAREIGRTEPPRPDLVPLFVRDREGTVKMTWIRPGLTDGTHTAAGSRHPHLSEDVAFVVARRSAKDAD